MNGAVIILTWIILLFGEIVKCEAKQQSFNEWPCHITSKDNITRRCDYKTKDNAVIIQMIVLS